MSLKMTVLLSKQMLRAGMAATFATIALTIAGGPVAAQQGQAKSVPKQTTQPAQKAPTAEAPAATGDAALRQRVEQLEEQLVDMQVVVGTLESLTKGGGGQRSPAVMPASSGGADPGRVEALENQVRALATQVEQLTQQVKASGGSTASSPRPSATLPLPGPTASAQPPPRSAPGGFNTTVIPDRDPIGQIISGNAPPTGQGAQPVAPAPQTQVSDASSKQLYETGYGLLLAQDYSAAEGAFEEFLQRFPNDPLAGNAQYWLGETFYVRGLFKQAAAAFLKGYQTYGRSSKAPDSLLKLAMSLDRLGQRDAACSSYGELSIKFPNAPGAVRGRADNERRRLGCA